MVGPCRDRLRERQMRLDRGVVAGADEALHRAGHHGRRRDLGHATKAAGPSGLASVAFADSRHGWAVGDGIILATTDGGASWRQQGAIEGDTLEDVAFFGVAFADDLHGWAVGPSGAILATANGGRTWEPQHSGTTVDLNGVAFADARDGLAVGDSIEGDDPLAGKLDGSVILRTVDGGASWSNVH